jgi:hypothetical protein
VKTITTNQYVLLTNEFAINLGRQLTEKEKEFVRWIAQKQETQCRETA